jgi:hypothetical protein
MQAIPKLPEAVIVVRDYKMLLQVMKLLKDIVDEEQQSSQEGSTPANGQIYHYDRQVYTSPHMMTRQIVELTDLDAGSLKRYLIVYASQLAESLNSRTQRQDLWEISEETA